MVDNYIFLESKTTKLEDYTLKKFKHKNYYAITFKVILLLLQLPCPVKVQQFITTIF